MNVESLMASMTPATYTRLREAVETGKWPDGRALDDNQKAVCMQAVMLYQAKVEHSEEHMTVNAAGEIVHKSKQTFLKEMRASSKGADDPNSPTIAIFKQDDI